MSFLACASAIKARWASNWPHTATAYDNSTFSPGTNASWVRLTVRSGNAAQVTLGVPSRDRHAGVVIAQIFVPFLQGEDRARWLADRAASVFRKVNLPVSGGEIVFGVPYPVSAETAGDDWFQMNVNCPYRFDVLS